MSTSPSLLNLFTSFPICFYTVSLPSSLLVSFPILFCFVPFLPYFLSVLVTFPPSVFLLCVIPCFFCFLFWWPSTLFFIHASLPSLSPILSSFHVSFFCFSFFFFSIFCPHLFFFSLCPSFQLFSSPFFLPHSLVFLSCVRPTFFSVLFASFIFCLQVSVMKTLSHMAQCVNIISRIRPWVCWKHCLFSDTFSEANAEATRRFVLRTLQQLLRQVNLMLEKLRLSCVWE